MATRKISPAAQIAQIISTMGVVELWKLCQELGLESSLYNLAELVQKYEDEFNDADKWRVVLPVVSLWDSLPDVIEPAQGDRPEASYPASPIRYIKAIRETLGIGLKEAKDIVDKASTVVRNQPRKNSTIWEGESESDAMGVYQMLTARGLVVELK